MKKLIIILFIAINTLISFGQQQSNHNSVSREIPYTQDDRDRLVRVEVKIEERFDAVSMRLEKIENFMLWGFGILFAGMVSMIGFVLWDRAHFLHPLNKKLMS